MNAHLVSGRRRRGQAALGLLLAGAACGAHAVVTTASFYFGTRTLTLRVGTATAGAVDTVQFDVGNTASGNALPTAANPHGNGVPVSASTPPVPIRLSLQVPPGNSPQTVTTTVTSPAALSCVSGGCGSAVIPFTAISWVAAPAATGDFQNGTFAGGSTQTLQTYTLAGLLPVLVGGTAEVSTTLTFSYANTTAYPAGNYRGTVIYTASLP